MLCAPPLHLECRDGCRHGTANLVAWAQYFGAVDGDRARPTRARDRPPEIAPESRGGGGQETAAAAGGPHTYDPSCEDEGLALEPPHKRPRVRTCPGGHSTAARAGRPAEQHGARPPSGGARPPQPPGALRRQADSGGGGGGEGEDEGDDSGQGDDDDDDEGDGATEALRADDTQCSWCDDGGMLLQCDGPCMRSFHCGGLLERDDEGRPGRFLWQPEGSSDACNPLRLDQELAHAIITSPDPFQCPNCLANRHVCFACGKLGVAGKDVFPCIAASCGKFYHRKCASNGKGAAAGEEGPLLCGLHSCGACGAQGDSPDDDKGELVPCRRCPVAFHRACIPQRLYEDDQDRVWLYEADEEGNPLPGVTVGRSLLYCAKHALEPSGVAKQRTSFTDDLWRAWRRHCAQQYPHLATSKQWLLPAASAAAAAAAAVGKKRPASAAGRAAAKAEARPSGEVGGQDARAAAGSAAARAVAEAAFAAARAAVFKEDVRRNTRQPVPYDTCMRKTVDERVLAQAEASLAYAAAAALQAPRDDARLRSVVDRGAVVSLLHHHDTLATVLAPYLHGDRYSSYGRHFTASGLLGAAAARLVQYLRGGDVVVDFSCGANEFVPLVKRAAAREGVVVGGRAYDIIVAKDLEDFMLASWFDVRPGAEGLEDGRRLVIGLNPPFGKDNSLARKFVEHAAAFRPRLMVLIVPPATFIPPGYTVVFEDRTMCKGEEFYVPGTNKRSWNKTWPALRILARTEHCQRRRDALGDSWEVVEVRR